MKMIFSLSTMIMLILLLMISILNFISKKTFSDREKNSPFECGFDPKTSARLPFSMQFFLIAMIFLIFDVELTLILPLIKTIKMANMISFMTITIFFISTLLFGLFHEWEQGSLEWMK